MNVLVFADLALASLAQRRHGRDRQFMLWTLLRPSAPAGRAARRDLLKATDTLKLSTLSMHRIISGGDGIFWVRGRHRDLWLRQPAKVAAALGVRSFRAAFRIPDQYLHGKLGRRRAVLGIRSIASLRRGLPTSIHTMTTMANTTPRTMREWRKLSGLHARANYLLVAPLQRSQLGDFYPNERGLRAIPFEERPWLVRQLPNSLPQLEEVGGVRSHLRRANRRLRRLTAGKTPCDIPGAGNARIRRYHVRDRRRRADPSTPGYSLVTDPANPREPRLWEPWPPRPSP